jgi:hypothetical protein
MGRSTITRVKGSDASPRKDYDRTFVARRCATSVRAAARPPRAGSFKIGCSTGRSAGFGPRGINECLVWCLRFHNALELAPVAWQNGLRLLTGEHQSVLYSTALHRVVFEAEGRHGAN